MRRREGWVWGGVWGGKRGGSVRIGLLLFFFSLFSFCLDWIGLDWVVRFGEWLFFGRGWMG